MVIEVTLELRSFFHKKCKEYCEQIGFYEQPLLLFTKEELRLIGENDRHIAKHVKEELGLSWDRGKITNVESPVIWLNISNSDFLWQMIDILIHEIVHLRFPDLEHGNKFQEVINNVILGRRY